MNKWNKIILISIGLLTIAFLVSLFLNLNNFPIPTGPFGVGKLSMHLKDTSRQETNSAIPASRELELTLWYPTDHKVMEPCCCYDRDALESAKEFMSSRVPKLLFKGLNNTRTFAQKHKPIAKDTDTLPIIIMPSPPGPMIQNYSWITEELASQGYIVVGINHPYLAAITRLSNGQIINGLYAEKRKQGRDVARAWKATMDEVAIEDIRFVLDSLPMINSNAAFPLYHHFDLERIGICAHSRAGSWAISVSRLDDRIKAAVIMDSVPHGAHNTDPIAIPMLFLLAEKSHINHGPEAKEDYEKIMALVEASKPMIYLEQIPNIGHSVFTDAALLLDETILTQLLSHVINIDLDASLTIARDAIRNIRSKIINFFAEHLHYKLFNDAEASASVI